MSHPENENCSQAPRNLVILFDGTNQNYDSGTNIARLRDALIRDRDDPDTGGQLIHYERGIGALEDSEKGPNSGKELNSKQDKKFERYADLMFAKSLKKHLMAAFTFVLRNCELNTPAYFVAIW